MLEVGNGKLSLAENRTHFSMWAMLAAPLLAGNDLPNMKPEINAILTNRDVIAIDQDPLGHEARAHLQPTAKSKCGRAISQAAPWPSPSSTPAATLLNASVPSGPRQLGLHGAQHAKDLWTGKEMELTDNMPIELASHDILLVRIVNQNSQVFRYVISRKSCCPKVSILSTWIFVKPQELWFPIHDSVSSRQGWETTNLSVF